MDARRSWLWRRKSSDKSSGETESSGSMSPHSGRFSDEQAYPNHNSQSPEVTSKAAPISEEVADSVTLSKKLSAALLSISAKEELVNQHAKVAEEAVTGWEKAENEVMTLKHQLEVLSQKNTALEDRISHLDGALKECMRQLRQAREDQLQKIDEAVAKKDIELNSIKFVYQSQLDDLQAQLQNAKAKVLTSNESAPKLRASLEALEKENSALKLEVLSRAEEIEIRIIEKELSNQAAETASKQLLESIKKVAKLEAECLRLKTLARKASLVNDNKSVNASSIYVDSITDSQSDCGERLNAVEANVRKMIGSQPNEIQLGQSESWVSSLPEQNRTGIDKGYNRNTMSPSVDINLMDDFLEMERLVMLPNTDSESSVVDLGAVLDKTNIAESQLKIELENLIHRTAELEEKLERTQAEKSEIGIALMECQKELEISQSKLHEAQTRAVELELRLVLANESARAAEEESVTSKEKIEMAESKCRCLKEETENLQLKVISLNREIGRQKSLLESTDGDRQLVESRLKHVEAENETLLSKIVPLQDELKREKFLSKSINEKREDAESQLRHVQGEMELLRERVTALEDELDKEKSLSKSINEKREDAESKLRRVEDEMELLQVKVNALQDELEKEKFLSESDNLKREAAETQLRCVEAEAEILLSKVKSLEEELRKEKCLSADNIVKCQKLKYDLSKRGGETELKQEANSNGELEINQEIEIALAAKKFSECQKTIASLGQQLKSLATLEDFLLDSEDPLEFSCEGSWTAPEKTIEIAS